MAGTETPRGIDGVEKDAQGRGSSANDEGLLRYLMQKSSDISAILEANGTIRYVSPAVERVLGYRPEDLVGTVFSQVHPDDLPSLTWSFAKVLEGSGGAEAMEWRLQAADGSWRILEVIHNNLLDDPAIRGVVLNARDVTERVRADEELRRMGRAIDATSDGIVITDPNRPDNPIIYVNLAFERITGYLAEEILGRNCRFLQGEDRDQPALSELRAALREGREFQGILRNYGKDGTPFFNRLHVAPVYDEGSRLVNFVGVQTDVSARMEAEEKYRSIFENTVEGITQTTLDGRILAANPAMARLLGYDSTKELMASVPDLARQLYLDTAQQEKVSRLSEQNGELLGHETSIRRKDGSEIWISVNVRAVRDGSGGMEFFVSTAEDVTERKRMEETLRRSAAALAEAQVLAHLGSWEWDINTGEVWWSEETYRIYGFEPGAFVPTLKKLQEVFHPDDRYMIRMAIDEAYREAKPYDFEHRIVRPNGEVRWVHRRAEVIVGENGEPLRLIGTSQDITKRKALEERLEHQAFHDHLTDLPNRRLFVDRLKQALKRTLRGGKVAVLFLDLDGFKVVNDSLGHEAGDRLLIKVAERLKYCLRPKDTFSRFGGDEFTVLIEDVKDTGEAARVAERISAEFRTPFLLEDRELFVSASIGIALGDAPTKAPEDLLRSADTAMFRAKEERSEYQVFERMMHEQVVARLGLQNDLRTAIEAGAGREFVLTYQPIVELQSGETRSVEALVRWEHPRRGLLGPQEFIPLAEETDLIVPLGKWIMEEACRQVSEWNERRLCLPALAVSVNVSSRQLCRPELAETVEGVLRQSGLEPQLLTLEVTESAVLKVGSEDKASLDNLRSLGVRLAIDDFGTGYSSLSYLKRLRTDVLKIDKSFVWNLGEETEDKAIVQTIVELAHVLGMEVVGEGVEDAGKEVLLREMGCDFAQGYYFSRPLSPEDVAAF